MNERSMRAAASDTKAYIDLLCCAGTESARIDFHKYGRTLPGITLQALGIEYDHDGTLVISEAAKSGDGTIENVGIKVDGMFQCLECRQRFDSDKALNLHWKFNHDP